ncbi:hypothetical protein QJQ45_023041 [Haematococcus lacustris]|nr:hypothetical protein QJQ45_023041 [Haematococcus lacustris]
MAYTPVPSMRMKIGRRLHRDFHLTPDPTIRYQGARSCGRPGAAVSGKLGLELVAWWLALTTAAFPDQNGAGYSVQLMYPSRLDCRLALDPAFLCTRKCNFKESEAAKEMAKTDDNVKELLEKPHNHTATHATHADTPSTMKAFWALVQAAYPKTKASGCWMHVINLTFNGNHGGQGQLAAGQPGAVQGQLAAAQPGAVLGQLAAAQPGLTNSVLDTVLTANPCMWWQTYGHGFGVLRDVAMRLLSIPATSASTERVCSTFKPSWSDHRQSMLMGRMWMSSYIYFNRRALKGTRGQTRSSEEERAEFEEWLQHQPNGISE